MCKNKKEKVETLREEFEVNKENILYVGDDLNDLTVRKVVGLLITPNDASKTQKFCDAILKNNGLWGQRTFRDSKRNKNS